LLILTEGRGKRENLWGSMDSRQHKKRASVEFERNDIGKECEGGGDQRTENNNNK